MFKKLKLSFQSAIHLPPRLIWGRIIYIAKLLLRKKLRLEGRIIRRQVTASRAALRRDLPLPVLPFGEAQIPRADPQFRSTLGAQSMRHVESLEPSFFMDEVEAWHSTKPVFFGAPFDVAWWSFPLSQRCISWMQYFARHRRAIPPSFEGPFLRSLVRQLDFLSKNLEVHLGGNHLIRNLKCLMWAGRFFASKEAERVQRQAERRLRTEIARQILADGMHFELSASYHFQVLGDLIECFSVAQDPRLKRELAEVIDRMLSAAASVTHPDGKCSLFNDSKLRAVYKCEDYASAWLGLSGRAIQPSQPIRAIQLRSAGLFGFRIKDDLFLYKCGQIAKDPACGHAHADVFSFEWTVQGRRVVVDTGSFGFSDRSIRQYCRSTSAHNTVTISDRDQAEFWGRHRVAGRPRVTIVRKKIDPSGLEVVAEHDGYRRLMGRPIHRRTLGFDGLGVRVVDEIVGGSGQQAVSRLLLHPECTVSLRNGEVDIQRGPQRMSLRYQGALELEDAFWSPEPGSRIPCKRVVMKYGRVPCVGRFHLRKVPTS